MTELYILEGIKEEELTNLAKKKNSWQTKIFW